MSINDRSTAIITRTKNRPLFLERAINSVHSQSFEDFVHVIINDAGDSRPVDDLVEKYTDLTKGRVRVIHNTESHGMEAATNKAIKSANSTYIAIHDDDDTWHPDFLKLTVAKLEETGAMGVVARADKVVEEVTGGGIRQLKAEPWMSDMKVISLYRQCIDNQMTPITFLYRRNAFDEVGMYDESLPVCGDWDFGIRFMQKYDVEFLDPGYALAFYHHRKFVAGVEGNTNFGSGKEKHRYYVNLLANKYLRQELAEGRLGVGYIMSSLRYNRSYTAGMVRRAVPGFITKRLQQKVED